MQRQQIQIMRLFPVLLSLGLGLLLGAGVIANPLDVPAAAQTSDLAEADRLNQQVLKLYRKGKYTEAIPFAQRLIAVRKKTTGA